MRLTKRCIDLLQLLKTARWLSTRQIRRRFFPAVSADATRKRLRILTRAGYLFQYRENRMTEALFSLGREGKRVLEKQGSPEIFLERKPPKQWDHFAAINDLRISAELTEKLSYFFSAGELAALKWPHPIIPDAVFSVEDRTFAAELDRGLEGIRFFLQTKIPVYRSGLPGFPVSAVLIVVDRKTRMERLARAIADEQGRFLFSTLEAVTTEGLLSPVFYKFGTDHAVSII